LPERLYRVHSTRVETHGTPGREGCCHGVAIIPALLRVPWRGLSHESIETTQIYLDADLAMKQAVLDKTKPPEGKPGQYRPDDPLLAFLKGL